MMMTMCVVIGLAVVALVIAPFFLAKGGPLQAASSVNSPEKLEGIRRALLERYLEDEKAFEAKAFSKAVWERRRTFLANRFIDVTRRLDFLRNVEAARSRGTERTA